MLNSASEGIQIQKPESFYIGKKDTEGSIKIFNEGGELKHSVYLDGGYKNVSSHNQGYDLLYNTDYTPITTFDEGNRTVTVAPQVMQTYFYFLSNGKLFLKSSSEQITIPDVTGEYYIYYDNNGVLQYVLAENITGIEFYQYAITYYVYWNKETQGGLSWNEKHGIEMSATTHIYNHNTFGARYARGLSIEGLSAGANTFSQISEGLFYDEDISHIIDNTTSVNTLWREGTNGAWRWTTAGTSYIGYKPSGNTYYVWNEFDGSTWKLTEGLSDSDFYIYFFIAFPGDDKGRIFRVPGQNAYPNVGDARNAIETEKNKLILDGLPGPEFVFIGSVIIKRNGNLRPLTDGSLYLDLRTPKGGVGNQSNVTLENGSYTPLAGNYSNVDSATPYQALYTRVGNIVSVTGAIYIDTTTSSNNALVSMSLPIASTIQDTGSCSGTISVLDSTPCGYVTGDTANHRARIYVKNLAAGTLRYSYQYKID